MTDTAPQLTRPAMLSCAICNATGRVKGDYCPHPGCFSGYVAIPAAEVVEAFERSGFDISACSACGRPVVCLPDGLPICEPCHAKEA